MEKHPCAGRVSTPGGFTTVPCSRYGKIERGEKHYCKTHDPVEVKARDKAREERWNREWEAEKKIRERNKTLTPDTARELIEALTPFAVFAEKFDQNPLGGLDDEFYGIHYGTEFKASLRFSDCRKALKALSKAREEMG